MKTFYRPYICVYKMFKEIEVYLKYDKTDIYSFTVNIFVIRRYKICEIDGKISEINIG